MTCHRTASGGVTANRIDDDVATSRQTASQTTPHHPFAAPAQCGVSGLAQHACGFGTPDAPIARVVNGMHVLRALFSGYGDGPPRGGGPDQSRIEREGNLYLERTFPRLDSIVRARIVR